MKNLDECIKKVIGISEDANKLTPMDKGECKLVAEEWATQQVKNLTLHRVSVSFADFLLTHKKSDEVQKATAHQLFKEFIEAYER